MPKKFSKEMKEAVIEWIERNNPNASEAEKLKVMKNLEKHHLDNPDGSISFVRATMPVKTKKKVKKT